MENETARVEAFRSAAIAFYFLLPPRLWRRGQTGV
jgi:hypothetical protein